MEFKTTRNLMVGAMAATLSAGAVAQMEYNEPTRGFMLERGYTAENRKAGVDIGTGAGQDLTAGIRLGLPNSELVLNHNRLRPITDGVEDPEDPGETFDFDIDSTINEALFKVGMTPIDIDGNISIDWAAYGILSHFDPDEGDSVTNMGFGAAMTADIENFILNFNPELIFDDAAEGDASDVFINLGFGAHYNLPDTNIGRFQPGAEFQLSTRDDAAGDSVDPRLMLGTRWLYNENVTLDLVLVNLGSTSSGQGQTSDGLDQISIPGFVRLNVAF